MAITVTHAKTNAIADWTQHQLDEIIAGGAAPLPPAGTTLDEITLPSDWNADHVIEGLDDEYARLDGTNQPFTGQVQVPSLLFDTAATPPTNEEGLLAWNATDGTLNLGMNGGDITMQIGQEMFTKVRNNTGSTLENGRVVYANGSLGFRPTVAYAQADTEATSRVIGLLTEDIADNTDGFVTTMGYVRQIKTNYSGSGIWGTTWTEGDLLYVSKTDAGVLTNVEPAAPHHSDIVGTVGIVGNVGIGSILVNLDRHKSLEGLSDVNGTALSTTGQIPVWDNTAGYFDFTSNVGSFVPYTGATANVDLGAFDLSATDVTASGINGFLNSTSVVNLGNANTVAAGTNRITVGISNSASANGAIAIGRSNIGAATNIGLSNTNSTGIGIGQSNQGVGTSIGTLNSSLGDSTAVAIGYNNTATNFYAMAIGQTNVASDFLAVAVGYGNNATTLFSTAIGNSCTATGFDAGAFGLLCQQTGGAGAAIGYYAVASASGSTAIGSNITNSTANSCLIGSSAGTFSFASTGITASASLNLRTGSATAGTYPLKFTSGALLTTPVVGVEEFLTDKRYTTITTGTARKEYTLNDIALTATRVPFATTNGRLTDLATFTYATNRLSPTYMTLAAGTATAGTCPFVMTSGTLLTTAIAGGVEFLTDKFYGTITTGAARKEFTLNDTALTSGRVPFATTNGRLTDDADFTFATDTLTVTKAVVKRGGAATTAKVGGVIFDYFTDSSVGGAETDIYTSTLDASIFATNGDKVIATYNGNFVTVGTEIVQLKVYLAGTAIWDSTGIAVTTGTTSWNVDVKLIRVSSTVVRYVTTLTTTGASGFVYCTSGELTGLTLTNTNILKITGTSSGVGSGAGDIVGKSGYVEYKPTAT